MVINLTLILYNTVLVEVFSSSSVTPQSLIKPSRHHHHQHQPPHHPQHHQAVSLHLVLVDGLRLSLSSSLTLSPIKLLGPVARVAKELREELLWTSLNTVG